MMQFHKSNMFIKVLKYTLIIFFALKILIALKIPDYLSMPFNGESTFTVTILYYTILFILPFVIFKVLNIKPNYVLLLFASIVFSLFIAETTLRFYFKYPITYSERLSGEYYTMYDTDYNKISSVKNNSEDKIKHLHIADANVTRDYEAPEFNYTNEKTNELGLRGKLPSKNKKTIITLGDSFTESFGAPHDSTYPFLLEKHIAQIDTNIEIVNGGSSGSDPFFEFNLLKVLKSRYPVYGAIFMMNQSDINDVMMRGGGGDF